MPFNRLQATLALILIGLVVCAGARPRAGRALAQLDDNPLEPVPGNLRVPLLNRLEEAVTYLSAPELGKFYDIMPDECRKGLSKDEWLAQAHVEAPGQLSGLAVEEVRKVDPYDGTPHAREGQWWRIDGCAEYKKGSETLRVVATFIVVWRSKEWRVCSLGRRVGEGGSEETCSK